MGLLSWFSSTARKSAAAACLQSYFEICKHHGIFRDKPDKFANRIVATACDRLPDLAEGNLKPYILAAACVTVVMMDAQPESEEARLYALGLSAMLKAAITDPAFRPSVAEDRILRAAQVVLERWNDRPSPLLHGFGGGTGSAGLREIRPRAVPDTFKGREKAMEELIRRVNQ